MILPLLGEYVDSGFRTPRDRFFYSLRSNARYQLIVLGCGTAGLAYVFLQNGFEGTSVKSLIMALAYCWALIQAIYLMGHGLVAVPRRLIRNASVSARLRTIQTQAPKVRDKLEDAVVEMDELESELNRLPKAKHGMSGDHREWIQELAEYNGFQGHRPHAPPTLQASGATPQLVVTDQYLADLSRRLHRARHKYIRFNDKWDRLLQDAIDTKAVLNAAASKKLDFTSSDTKRDSFYKRNILSPNLRYILHFHVIPSIKRITGVFLGFASICIVWSEIVKFIAPQLSMISITVVHHRSSDHGEIGFAGQMIAALWILYMCTTALASLDEVKVWGNRALVRRNTYGESACWYGGQVAKLTVPLAYNFVTFLPRSIHRQTTFFNFLGRLIILTPLGKGFDYFFPIFILVPVCATLFNLYGRIKNLCGYGILDEDEEENRSGYGTGGWREGRDLINRELDGRLNLGSSMPLDGTSSPIPPGQRTRLSSGTRQPPYPSGSRAYPSASSAGRVVYTDQTHPRPPSGTLDGSEADESAISSFAHRVRNTLETLDRPDWIPNFTKRPRWMGGTDGNNESSGQADTGRVLGRWFGGRPTNGRVRL